MWPLLLDLSRDESKRILRRLELEAYSSLISAFRAQGILTKYKKKLLQELQHALSISTERHRAEVRRAVNDEQLSTIADNMCGPSTDADWLIEGRRLIPLMPRLVPQTAFTVTANQAVNLQVEKNAAMPNPAQTGNKDWGTVPEEEEESFSKKRRHAAADSISSVSAGTQTSRAATTSSSNNLQGISPVKITISKNSQTRNQNTNAVATQTQKVILVSTSGPGANGGANVLPKSISLPLVKAIPTTSVSSTGSGHPKMSIVMPNTTSTPAGITISNGNLGNIITVVTTSSTSLRSTSTNTTAVLGTSSTAFLPSSINIPKNRPKSVPKQKIPQLGQKPGVVIPVGAQSSHNTSGNVSVQGIQIKPATKSAIQIKHEGGMKIITQSIPTPGSKILPKPTPSGTPVVVVSGVSNTTTATTVSMVTRPVSTISVSQAGNSKILNINTQGGKVITTTKTVSPKTLHLTAVKSASGGTVSRPNVIVVTKAPKRPGIPLVTGITKGTSSVLPSSFEKDLVSFIHKQDTRNIPSNISTLKSPIEKKIIVTTTVPESLKSRHQQAQITEGDGTGKTSSLLAELIQAAGILPDNLSSESTNTVAAAAAAAAATTTATTAISVTDVAITPDGPVEVIQGSNTFSSTTAQTKLSAQPLSSNEWFEYDVTDDQPQSYSNDSNDAIAALLEMQHQSNSSNIQLKEKDVQISSSTLELSNLSEQQHFYTIEQAMNILSQEEKESVTSISSSAESLDGFLTPSAIPISVPKQLNEQIQVIPSAPPSSSTTTTVTSATTLNQITCTAMKGSTSAKFMAFASQDSNTKNNISSTALSFSLPSTTSTSSLSSTSSSSKVLDLLSSSLEQAQIDLHTYQFIEDIDNFNKKTVVQTVPINSKESLLVQGSNIELAAVSTSLLASPLKKGLTQQLNCLEENTLPKIETGTNLNEKISVKKDDKNGPVCNDKDPCPNLEPKTLGIPEKKTGITADYLQTQEVVTDLKQFPDKSVEFSTNTTPSLSVEVDNAQHEVITKKMHSKLGTSLSISTSPEIISVDANVDTNSAYQKKDVELNSENLDQLNVKNVDFLCKESLDEISLGSPAGTEFGSSSDSQGDGSYCGDLNPIRVSQRKRKPPASLDDNPSPSSRGGWVRIALSLLERVSRYRGVNREKRELNAASWFNRPVDPLEAPDYYTIVKKPMDFSRIRKNLESGHYGTLEDFHNDMLLVQSNCNLYNPMESSVQKDCEEVFTFYIQEYEKMVEKWQKSRVPYAQANAPSIVKKVKIDKISTKS